RSGVRKDRDRGLIRSSAFLTPDLCPLTPGAAQTRKMARSRFCVSPAVTVPGTEYPNVMLPGGSSSTVKFVTPLSDAVSEYDPSSAVVPVATTWPLTTSRTAHPASG